MIIIPLVYLNMCQPLYFYVILNSPDTPDTPDRIDCKYSESFHEYWNNFCST